MSDVKRQSRRTAAAARRPGLRSTSGAARAPDGKRPGQRPAIQSRNRTASMPATSGPVTSSGTRTAARGDGRKSPARHGSGRTGRSSSIARTAAPGTSGPSSACGSTRRHGAQGRGARGRPDPQYTGERDDSRAAEHATADHIARIKLAAAKVERSHLKQNALDDALAPLMKLAAAYRNQSDQDALAAYVIRQLHAAWAMGV